MVYVYVNWLLRGGYLQVLKNNTGVIKVFDPISTQMLIFSIILWFLMKLKYIQYNEYVFRKILTQVRNNANFDRLLANRRAVHPR